MAAYNMAAASPKAGRLREKRRAKRKSRCPLDDLVSEVTYGHFCCVPLVTQTDPHTPRGLWGEGLCKGMNTGVRSHRELPQASIPGLTCSASKMNSEDAAISVGRKRSSNVEDEYGPVNRDSSLVL